MKKILAVIIVLILAFSAMPPVSAAESNVIDFGSCVMSEAEFRSLKLNELSSLSTSVVWGNEEIDPKGYYYTCLSKKADNTALIAYNVTEGEFVWGYSKENDMYGWISDYQINLNTLIGMTLGSAELNEAVNYYTNEIMAGVWACRYENTGRFDRYDYYVRVDRSYQADDETGKITAFWVNILLVDHPFFQEAHITERDQKIAQIAAQANAKGSQYEALLYIHDYLAKNAEYDYDALSCEWNTEKFYYAHNAFGVINKNLGVCESYAKAFMLICEALNNPPVCSVILSNTHMWNIVLLDGEWYCVDVTWDDGGGDIVLYTYFLCGDPDVVDGASTDHVCHGKFCPSPDYADEKYVYNPHSLAYVPKVEAKQFEDGRQAHYKCSKCGKLFTDKDGKNETTLEALRIPATDTVTSLSTPTVSGVNVVGGIKVSWKSVANALSYKLYRREYSGGKWSAWKQIKELEGTEYIDQSVASGTKYQYAARAIRATLKSDYKASATVMYLATTNVTAKNVSGGLKASWSKVTGATSYTVYRREYRNSKWSGWKNLGSATGTSYTDKTVENGISYTYVVRAVSGNYMGSYTVGVSTRKFDVPKVTLKNASNGITASWNKVAGATGYEVYRQVYSSGKWSAWKKVATTSAVSYTDKTVKSGTIYRYTARPYYKDTKGLYKESGYLKFVGTPIVSVSANETSITASWSKISGADSYLVYRRTLVDGKWSKWTELKKQTATSYTDKTVAKNTQYQYTAIAYIGKTKSAYKQSETISAMVAPKVTVSNVKGEVIAKWGKISGADSYVVYRRELVGSKWSSWKNLGTTTNLSFEDVTAQYGKTYQYTARAIIGDVKSGYVASNSIVYLLSPNLYNCENGKNYVKVKWDTVNSAESYIIYRREITQDSEGAWKKIAEVADAGGFTQSYKDTSVVSGSMYQYTVRAASGDSVSDYREDSEAKIKFIVPPTFTLRNANGMVYINIPDDQNCLYYRIERYNGTWWEVISDNCYGFFADHDVVEGQTYMYRIIGITTLSYESAPSDTKRITYNSI